MNWEAEDLASEPHESNEPPGKRRRSWGPEAKSARYALKVLCPDELTKQILGPGGKIKDAIQQESQARLTFSKKADYFPNTFLRVLVIHADEIRCMLRALECIVTKLILCADQEHLNPAPPGLELIGKEPGEFVFRLCLPSRSSTVLIGAGGQNIKQLQAETGVKVFIENDIFVGHQLVRVIGQPAAINAGLVKVNEYVQKDAGLEAYWEYSQLVNFSDAMDPRREASESEPQRWEPGWQAPPATTAVAREAAPWNSNQRAHSPVVVPPRGAPHPPVVVPPPSRRGHDAARSSCDPGVEQLTEALHSMPEGTATMQYSMHFSLPDSLRRTWRESQEFHQYLEQTTGAKIEAQAEAEAGPSRGDAGSSRQMSLVGPLMGIYAAHILLMKKAMEVEREEREEAARRRQGGASNEASGSVQEMQAKVLELQKQLQQALAEKNTLQAPAGQGKNSGGGKGKGKGKSKSKSK